MKRLMENEIMGITKEDLEKEGFKQCYPIKANTTSATSFKRGFMEIAFELGYIGRGGTDPNMYIEGSSYWVNSMDIFRAVVQAHEGDVDFSPVYEKTEISKEPGLTNTTTTESIDALNATDITEKLEGRDEHMIVHQVPIYGLFYTILFMRTDGEKTPKVPKGIDMLGYSRKVPVAVVAHANFDAAGTRVGGHLIAFNISDGISKITAGTVAHEALHLTSNVMQEVGIKLTDKTEEAYTYLLDYFVDTIMQEAERFGFKIYTHKNQKYVQE